MQYFDKNGKEIKAGMKILMEDGSVELVYDTEDAYGNPNLGINASNEDFLRAHPNWAREFYSLSMFNIRIAVGSPSGFAPKTDPVCRACWLKRHFRMQ